MTRDVDRNAPIAYSSLPDGARCLGHHCPPVRPPADGPQTVGADLDPRTERRDGGAMTPLPTVHTPRAMIGAVGTALLMIVLTVTGPPGDTADGGRPALPTAGADWTRPSRGESPPIRGFERPEHRWSPGHRGIDLAAAPGDPVMAPREGTITFAGPVVDRTVLTITHDDGLRSSLEPVSATVVVGDRVVAGQVVGSLGGGPSHCDPAGCVHWGVREGEEYLDPWLLLCGGPVVLLPDTAWSASSGSRPVVAEAVRPSRRRRSQPEPSVPATAGQARPTPVSPSRSRRPQPASSVPATAGQPRRTPVSPGPPRSGARAAGAWRRCASARSGTR